MMKRRYKLIIALMLIIIILAGAYGATAYWWHNKYDKDTFNCVDMSYTLAPYFHKLGFNTRIFYGNNDTEAHAWLCINGIFFDATNLWFNDEHEYTEISFIDTYPYRYTDELIGGRQR